MSAYSIILSGEYVKEQSRLAATGTIKPGMLLQVDSAGKVTPHATAGGVAEKLVALEDALQGDTIADTYTIGNIVDTAIISPGSQCQVLVAAGQDIAVGDLLMSAGNGKLTERTSTNTVLFVAMEAADLTGSGAVDTLVAARAI